LRGKLCGINKDDPFTKKYKKEIPFYLFDYWTVGNYLEFGLPAAGRDLVIGI
jgi:hypothetical protein